MNQNFDDMLENLKSPDAWIKLILIIGFAIALYLIGFILAALTLTQALFVLFTGKSNSNLRYLGALLALYIQQIVMFLTYNSITRPFPFSDFPEVDPASYENDPVADDNQSPTADANTRTSEPRRDIDPTSGFPMDARRQSDSSTMTPPSNEVPARYVGERDEFNADNSRPADSVTETAGPEEPPSDSGKPAESGDPTVRQPGGFEDNSVSQPDAESSTSGSPDSPARNS